MIKRIKTSYFLGEIPCRSAQKTGGLGLSGADARAIHLGDDADCSEPRLKNCWQIAEKLGRNQDLAMK